MRFDHRLTRDIMALTNSVLINTFHYLTNILTINNKLKFVLIPSLLRELHLII